MLCDKTNKTKLTFRRMLQGRTTDENADLSYLSIDVIILYIHCASTYMHIQFYRLNSQLNGFNFIFSLFNPPDFTRNLQR